MTRLTYQRNIASTLRALLSSCIFITAAVSCNNKNIMSITEPQVSTSVVTNITLTSATSGGTIISNGGGTIVATGICWSKTNTIPTITNDTTKSNNTSGTFTGKMINLIPGSTYYVRAYAVSDGGIGYGNVLMFTTPTTPPDPTNVTFTYNGQAVTYGIITSAATGRKWLDRNLGAPNTPSGFDDWQNKGDLFQWGRKPDGHQLINRAATTIGTTAVYGTTTAISTSNDPGNSLFIISTTDPFDWVNPRNPDLWAVTGGVNNACPTGWHIPSKTEWEAEGLGTVQDAYTKLKITTGGSRKSNDGTFTNTINDGQYWTSTIFNGFTFTPYSFIFSSLAGPAYSSTINVNANGLSVRCIKD